jgi:hypothetical protein
MGLSANLAVELLHLARADALPRHHGDILEIGAQQISLGFMHRERELKEIAERLGRAAPVFPGYVPPRWWERVPWTWPWARTERLADDAPPSRLFWDQLGWSYTALDFDGHRDSVALDLNTGAAPAEWRNRFHVVLNAGTTEHVANQDNAFRVIHDAVCVGGIMIHELPASGMLTHGMYNTTSRFFWMLCRANGYQVVSLETLPGGRAPLHPDIVGSNRQYGRNRVPRRLERERMRDWFILATLRKTADVPFRTPLDVPPELLAQADQQAATA